MAATTAETQNPTLVDVDELKIGLASFIDQVVIPLEDANAELLGDHRGAFYDERGGYSADVVALIRKVRQAATIRCSAPPTSAAEGSDAGRNC